VLKNLSSEQQRKDFVEEMLRIVKSADEQGIVLRGMGAAAFRCHCPKLTPIHKALGRELSDLDLMGYYRQVGAIEKLFKSLGYQPRPLQAILSSRTRRIYIDTVNNRHVDVFLDSLVMCHTIDFKGRLEVDYPTIPLAELLLEKMQIVQLTEKDVKDTLVLVREHEVGESDQDAINSKYLARILSKDWGFYYTVTTNLKKIENLVSKYIPPLSDEDMIDIKMKITGLSEAIEREPKSLGWKIRARIGTKQKWYRDVETLEV